MRVIFALVLIAGLGLAGFGVYMASEMFNKDQAELTRLRKQVKKIPKLEPVVVATRELRYGMPLLPEDVKVVDWPVKASPENVFASLEDVLGPDGSKPRAIVRTIEPGEAILSTKVTEFGQDAGISMRLQKGMRAFTILVDMSSGVSGFLQPGDSVDIFWSGKDKGQPITRLILEKIEIIAIDQTTDEELGRPTVARTVTVAVDPRTVAALAQAQGTGKLQLSLRGIDDTETAGENVEVNMSDIVGRVDYIAPKEKVCTIKVRRGAQLVEIPTDCPQTN